MSSPTAELAEMARERRDQTFGTRITYSPKVFIPLTKLCRDRCGYCTFAQPPARMDSAFMPIDEVVTLARAGAMAGCHEALFTLGEAPEDRYEVARAWLSSHGHSSTVDYLVHAARVVLDETGLLPHANAGALTEHELRVLREVAPSQGMMLETTREDLACHRGAPDKAPQRRIATIEAAGRLGIPFTTGILVGIGESRRDRAEALAHIAEAHERHGHIQEVIVQNFLPKSGTSMAGHPPCDTAVFHDAISLARMILPTT
ncbi:MAG: 7,8-didemethyl-8-hydroxy-5-deazariboflavin synthase CofG, partial [Microthrixaceae bacterium]|nr:7,8-didemethyl-8-hydroxy-5-deazariboflavin synthase CofG [Microthrixaceae bacterium]